MTKSLIAVLVLLSGFGVGRARKKDIIERLNKAGANVDRAEIDGEEDALIVQFVNPQGDAGALEELRGSVSSGACGCLG